MNRQCAKRQEPVELPQGPKGPNIGLRFLALPACAIRGCCDRTSQQGQGSAGTRCLPGRGFHTLAKCRRHPQGQKVARSVLGTFALFKSTSARGTRRKKGQGWQAKAASQSSRAAKGKKRPKRPQHQVWPMAAHQSASARWRQQCQKIFPPTTYHRSGHTSRTSDHPSTHR